MKKCRASAPGKLILSGEHSVVYGKTAVALAINRYVHAEVSGQSLRSMVFHLPSLSYRGDSTIDKLRKLKNRVKHSYEKFLAGEYHIRDVLHKPFELAQFAFINALDHVETHLKGLHLETDSDLPTGCGLGSSAALAVSITGAVLRYYDKQVSEAEFFELVKAAENLQHGKTKGLDVMTSYHGGVTVFEDEQYKHIDCDARTLYLVNTGVPESSTGEVVSCVRERFENSSIWQDFDSIAHGVLNAVHNHFDGIAALLAENQILLEKIGVVPEKVKRFVSDLKSENIIAKQCGAGSVQGDAGGIVLLWADDIARARPIIDKYEYELMPVSVDTRGLTYD